VLRSVGDRRAELAVPGFMGTAARSAPLVPEGVMRTFRHLVHDDAAITRVDDDVRRAYLDRIERQEGLNATTRPSRS
jgi:hypothetical protein